MIDDNDPLEAIGRELTDSRERYRRDVLDGQSVVVPHSVV